MSLFKTFRLKGAKTAVVTYNTEEIENLRSKYDLTGYAATTIFSDPKMAAYYNKIAPFTKPRIAANWLIGPVMGCMKNSQVKDFKNFPIPSSLLVELINMTDKGEIRFAKAVTEVLPGMFQHPGKKIKDLVMSQ